MDMELMVKEMVEKKAEELISELVFKYVSDINMEDIAQDVAREKIDNEMWSGSETIVRDLTLESIRPVVYDWFKQNMYKDDLQYCIKEALISKLTMLNVDELITLFNETK